MTALEKWEIRAVRFKAMAENMARNIDGLKRRVFDGNYERADGETVCSLCFLRFKEHPTVDGSPTFRVACDGKVRKVRKT